MIDQAGKNEGVVKLLDIAETKEEIVIVMEYLEGGTIKEWMRAHRLSVDERVSTLAYLCETVANFHELGIAHRDLKMDNIIFDKKTSLPKVIDFGLSKIFL